MRKSIVILVGIITATVFSYSQTWEELIKTSQEFQQKGDFETALNSAQMSLEQSLKEETNSQEKHSVSLGEIGQIYYSMGNYSKAAEFFLMEKNYKEKVFGRAHPSYLLALNNLSSAYQYLGRLIEAKNILVEANQILEEATVKEDLIYSKTLHNFAKVHQTLGDYENAEKYYQKAIGIKKNSLGENSPVYANTIFNLGLLYQNLGNFEKAEKYIKQAIEIYKSNYDDNNEDLINAELQLAMILSSTNRKDEANVILKKRQQQIIQNKKQSDPDYASSLYNIAMLQWSLKNYKEANSLLLEVKTLVENTLGKTSSLYSSCLNSLGLVNWVQGNTDAAYDYLSQVVILRKLFYGNAHPFYAASVHNLAGLLSDMKNIELADKYYTESMDLTLQLIKTYFPFLSDEEKTRFNERIQERCDIYYNFVLQNCEQKSELKSKMLNYRLYTKGILLNTSIKVRNDILQSGDKYLIGKFDDWKSTREKIVFGYSLSKKEAENYGINIDSLENAANDIEKTLSKSSNIFKDNFKKAKYTWKDIQQSLNNDDALIEIIRINSFQKGWSENVFYIALIATKESKDNPELIIIDNKNELETKYINSYRNSIRFKLPDETSFSAFWAKIYDKVKSKKNIILSSDGVYNKINPQSIMPTSKKYLIDENSISIISNPLDLLEERGDRVKNKKAYLTGFPKYNLNLSTDEDENRAIDIEDYKNITDELKTVSLTELPGTKNEIEGIANTLKNSGWTVTANIDDKARKNSFKSMNDAGIIHIATHGYFLPDINTKEQSRIFGLDMDKALSNPLLRSGLFFAGAENSMNDINKNTDDNGILTAYEVMNLDLNQTELVVLSACETGLGDIKNGEGVYGLQRAFKIAGAGCVIMSLWKVDDEATHELMLSFYSKWQSGKTKQEALKEAQLELKSKYEHPYFWAGFVLITN